MTGVFISYARSTEADAKRIDGALRGLGYEVWRDDQIAAHQAFGKALEERLTTAKVVLVLWSADGADSEWVRSEASRARAMGKLVQLTLDNAPLPMPFDQIQCANLVGWAGEPDAPGWRKVIASIADLMGKKGVAPAPAESMPNPLPSKPSIAVLPFANLSGDPEQDYFADGMVEEITRALSRMRSIFVIGAGSSLTFKGKGASPQEAARQLGVRYILEGSVRRAGGRVRIAVKLIDATDGAQIWADRFEDTLEDVFALQDRVALSVVGVIEPTVRDAEVRHALARPIQDVGSYDLSLRALPHYQAFTKSGMLAALDLFDRAIAIDPDYGWAIGMALACHAHMIVNDWAEDREAHVSQIKALTARALRCGGDDPEVLLNVAGAMQMTGADQQAVAVMIDRAMALNPGSSGVWLISGVQRLNAGQPDLAFQHMDTALRLDPFSRFLHIVLGIQGAARFIQTRFADAIQLLNQSIQLRPEWGFCHPFLAASYANLGDVAAARKAIALSTTPTNMREAASGWPSPIRELLLDGLSLAGADGPPENEV